MTLKTIIPNADKYVGSGQLIIFPDNEPILKDGTSNDSLAGSVIDSIEHDTRTSYGICRATFRMPGCPQLASRRITRDILLLVDQRCSGALCEHNGGDYKATLLPSLVKGGYTVTVLWDIIKTGMP